MMPTRPDLRVGDAERDTTAALLREHYAQGRLSTDELSDRLDATFSATTQGQLAEITHDLPHLPAAAAAPAAQPAATPASRPGHPRALGKVMTLLAVAVAVLGVLLIAHQGGGHAPRAFAEIIVLMLVLRAIIGRAARRHRWEHHAARYGADGSGTGGFSDRPPRPGHAGRHFHEHHHEHHHGRNGHSYRYSYRYEWSGDPDPRSESERSERIP